MVFEITDYEEYRQALNSVIGLVHPDFVSHKDIDSIVEAIETLEEVYRYRTKKEYREAKD